VRAAAAAQITQMVLKVITLLFQLLPQPVVGMEAHLRQMLELVVLAVVVRVVI
jgi:hypothetical protein